MPPASPIIAARRRAVPWGGWTLLAVLALFAAGIVSLLELRFGVGDVYPPYSTLRTDPLGAKAFFESLDGLPGLRVERNLRPLATLGTEPLRPRDADNGEAGFTCFCLGLTPVVDPMRQWPFPLDRDAVERLEEIVRRGGRVVLTFQPTQYAPNADELSRVRKWQDDDPDETGHGRPGTRRGPIARKMAEKARRPDLIERWGIDFRRSPAEPPRRGANAAPGAGGGEPDLAVPAAALARAGGGDPDAPFAADRQAVPWHTAVDFDLKAAPAQKEHWRALYERLGRPVIVARTFGTAGGELILVSDSYFLSNEGLRDAPAPALLAALVGPGRRLIFDESHLGIDEQPGLMTLARRYRLQGALAALALLAVLFVWRNMVSLVPSRGPRAAADGAVRGHDAGRGYLNLLRRSVRPGDLPGVCLERWRENVPGTTGPRDGVPSTAGAVERARAVLAEDAARPVRQRAGAAAVYRALCAAVRAKG